jgi:hypothetical protein
MERLPVSADSRVVCFSEMVEAVEMVETVEERAKRRSQDGTNLQCWGPLVLQDIETDPAQLVCMSQLRTPRTMRPRAVNAEGQGTYRYSGD